MAKLIVVATDGSAAGQRATQWAAKLAAALAAEVIPVHVRGSGAVPEELRHMAEAEHIADVPPAADMAPLSSVPRPDTRIAALAHEDRQIHEYLGHRVLNGAVELLNKRAVSVRAPQLLDGEPAEAILAAASDAGADMIVVGSRGMGPLRSILGSVSYKVTQLADCTCVVVK